MLRHVTHDPLLAKVVVLRRIRRLMIVMGGMTATPMSMPAAVHVVLLRSPTAAVAC